MNSTKNAILMLGLFTTAFAGCAPSVELVATRSRRIVEDGRLKAVVVESAYMTNGLHGEQMVYEVGVLNSAKRPVMANRSSYRNSRGQVAGSRTVRAEEVTGTPSTVAVEIPVNVIGLGERDLPAYAQVRMAATGGEKKVKDAETIIELPLGAPDVFAMGGPASGVPADESVADSGADESRYAARTGDDSRESWSDASGSEPRRSTRERASSDDRRDGGHRWDRSSDRGAEEEGTTEPSRSASADRASRDTSSPVAPEPAADDDLTYWTPDRKPIRRRDTVDDPRRGSHDDRVAPGQSGRSAERRPQTPADARQDEIAELEAVVRRSPNDLQSQMRLRMLYLAEHREGLALAPIDGADADTNAKIEEYLAAILPAVRTGRVDPSSVTLGQLDEWVERSRAAKELKIPVAAFCSSIDGFGKFRAFDPAVFDAHNFPRLLIYLEVENYVSTRARTGVYRTLLSVQQKLLNSSGEEVWSTLDQEIPDLSNGLREDFFLAIGPVNFQQALPPDSYTLVISLRDVLGGASCEKKLRFRIDGR